MQKLPLVVSLSAIVTLYMIIVSSYSKTRPIDGDEGFYALASRLISDGQQPYLDFFYPQAPLLPYLYCPVVRLFGNRLSYLRVLSTVFAALTFTLWLHWLTTIPYARCKYIWLFLILAFLSPSYIDWAVTVKTYSSANLFISAGIISLLVGIDNRKLLWLAASGLFFGITVSIRLLYAPSIALLVVVLFFRKYSKKLLFAWTTGLAIGMAPIIAFIILDFDRFVFNNIAFHQLRSGSLSSISPSAIWGAFCFFALTMLRFPSLTILLFLSLYGVLSNNNADPSYKQRIIVPLAWFVCGHIVVSVLPTPHQSQYLVATLIPLLIPLALEGIVNIPKNLRPALLPGIIVICLASGIYESTQRRPDVLSSPVWTWEHFRMTCNRIESLAGPHDIVLSFWPGYVFETGRRPVPGFENQFAVWASTRVTKEERFHYRISGRDELMYAFRSQMPATVVVGSWMYDLNEILSNQETAALLEVFNSNYVIVAEIDPVKIAMARRIKY